MKSNNLRWFIHGIITELYHNIFIRTLYRIRMLLFATQEEKLEITTQQQHHKYRQRAKKEIAVVTGATGGIGSQIVRDLAYRGYDVIVAARNINMGKELVKKIQGELKMTTIKETYDNNSKAGEEEEEDDLLPLISFVEYHADVPQSALDMAASIKDMNSPLTILINNAGIMGKSKQLSMKVNLLGPAYLTFALLPLMSKSTATSPCKVINVGSSAHLRATCVINEEYLPASCDSEADNNEQSYINNLPNIADDDLSTYAQSKLALMQFSTLLRYWSPSHNDNVQVIDAHPGLVWTPLLRNHIGNGAVNTLTRTGLANLIYKSSFEGAQAIVSAINYSADDTANKEQVYYVNGKPGGYSASESTQLDASKQLWKCVLKPELEGVNLPQGWGDE